MNVTILNGHLGKEKEESEIYLKMINDDEVEQEIRVMLLQAYLKKIISKYFDKYSDSNLFDDIDILINKINMNKILDLIDSDKSNIDVLSTIISYNMYLICSKYKMLIDMDKLGDLISYLKNNLLLIIK